MNLPAPQLWIVAGPNGAGKSTLVERYTNFLTRYNIAAINPDVIAGEIDPIDPTRAALSAGKEALRRQDAFLSEMRSFLVETTFSGKHELGLMRRASALGYKVNCVYIGVNSPKQLDFRVRERVSAGGHFVPSADIMRRYERSLKNLPKAITISDRVYILDNSLKNHRLILSIEKGRKKYASERIPQWCVNHLQDALG